MASKNLRKGETARSVCSDGSVAATKSCLLSINEPEGDLTIPLNLEFAGTRDDAIRVLAYEYWEAAGRPAGDGVDFWLEAERQINGPAT